MNIDEEIFKKLDTWVFKVETQAGEKLHVIDAIDLKEIIPEIMEVVKKFNYISCCTELKDKEAQTFHEWIKDNGYYLKEGNWFNKHGYSRDINKLKKYYELNDCL